MAFKLIVKPLVEIPNVQVNEYSYDQKVVRIGRKTTNDIQLQDLRRLVSGQHAEVRENERHYIVIDVGSKNGTQLNGEKLIAGKEYPLSPSDEIIIGDFNLQFYPVETRQPESASQVSGSQFRAQNSKLETRNPEPQDDLFETAASFKEELNRIYRAYAERDPLERENLLVEIVLRKIKEIPTESRDRFFKLIQLGFGINGEKTTSSSADAPQTTTPASQNLNEALSKIVGRYIGKSAILNSPGGAEQVMERIDRILQVTVKALFAAVRSRREFEEDFNVEATRIFSWKLNPLKLAEEEKQIGEYLLDPGREKSTDKVISELEELFSDLAYHQIGLIAGMRESQIALLKKLDPDEIEREAAKKIWPLSGVASWNHFKEKYKELKENEVKTFEKILGPNFARGYLSVQKKKKAS
jgi:type VI secretion system FHA domain protein